MHFVCFWLISLYHYTLALACHILLLHIFMLWVWTSHWWFRYALALVPMWKWTFGNPGWFSWHCCNYCFEKWNSKKGFPPFPWPHLVASWYPYHNKQFLNLNEPCHSWSNPPIFGIVRIINDNTCNGNCHLGKSVIICGAHIKKWLHSHYHKNLWLFSLLFQPLLNFLWFTTIAHHERSSLVPYFLLLVVCVHVPIPSFFLDMDFVLLSYDVKYIAFWTCMCVCSNNPPMFFSSLFHFFCTSELH